MDPLLLLAGAALLLSSRREQRPADPPPLPRAAPQSEATALEWAEFVAREAGRIIDAAKNGR